MSRLNFMQLKKKETSSISWEVLKCVFFLKKKEYHFLDAFRRFWCGNQNHGLHLHALQQINRWCHASLLEKMSTFLACYFWLLELFAQQFEGHWLETFCIAFKREIDTINVSMLSRWNFDIAKRETREREREKNSKRIKHEWMKRNSRGNKSNQ